MRLFYLALLPLLLSLLVVAGTSIVPLRCTTVSIRGDDFLINGRPTYAGLAWHGHRIEGLLMNSRMVQGVYDDLDPQTAARWAYPDTGRWDPARNTREFLAAMPKWRCHRPLSFTINLKGASLEGYSKGQPWINSAFEPGGRLRPAYFERLRAILDFADELGMAPIVGYFYFGQDERLLDEAAVVRAVDDATNLLLDGGWRNALVEIANETNPNYNYAILRPNRVHELIARVKGTTRDGRRLLVSTFYDGGDIPPGEEVVRAANFLLIHDNGVSDPDRIRGMVRQTRSVPGHAAKPALFNEEDHFNFDKPMNNCIAALSEHASWGYFDFRMRGEGFEDGFQSVPVDRGIGSEREVGFFRLISQITGYDPEAPGDRPPVDDKDEKKGDAK